MICHCMQVAYVHSFIHINVSNVFSLFSSFFFFFFLRERAESADCSDQSECEKFPADVE